MFNYFCTLDMLVFHEGFIEKNIVTKKNNSEKKQYSQTHY